MFRRFFFEEFYLFSMFFVFGLVNVLSRVNEISMYLVEDLYKKHGARLGLEIAAGTEGMKRRIKVPEAHRPGLSLSGYQKGHEGVTVHLRTW